MDYTVEVYKLDRRCKDGKKLVEKIDCTEVDYSDLEAKWPVRKGYVRFIHETYVTRKNALTGQEFQERYDTPWYASPRSETYWSA